MSGVWIGQARSIGLWTNVNQYVETYINIHPTVIDEPWYHTWRNLITQDQILNKERHFQFIAFRITQNPDATIEACIHKLFDRIPKLLDHIDIVDTNEKGNIQYTYIPYTPISQSNIPSQETSTNLFTVLQETSFASDDPDDESNNCIG